MQTRADSLLMMTMRWDLLSDPVHSGAGRAGAGADCLEIPLVSLDPVHSVFSEGGVLWSAGGVEVEGASSWPTPASW